MKREREGGKTKIHVNNTFSFITIRCVRKKKDSYIIQKERKMGNTDFFYLFQSSLPFRFFTSLRSSLNCKEEIKV